MTDSSPSDPSAHSSLHPPHSSCSEYQNDVFKNEAFKNDDVKYHDSEGHEAEHETRVDALWKFALTLYSQPDVSATAIRLQDEACIDVPELLWLCWLEQRREHPHTLDDLQEVREWQQQITSRLRALRRILKPMEDTLPRLSPLRNRIKEAELQAEKETLHRLALLPWKDGAPSEVLWARWKGEQNNVHDRLIQKIRNAASAGNK